MIKYSIRRQMTAIFIGLFSLILGLVLIINNAFLGHYYLSHKADDLIRTYNDVNAKLESGSLSDSDSVRDILTQLERANVDLVVVDGGGNAILTTLGESDPRLKEMFSGLFGMEGVDHENILKRNEDYTIYRDKSSQVQRDVEYLKMWGRFMDGSWFIMQCPYASITESASLANRFLIYLGCIGMVIGGLLVWMFSRSITRPIMELAGLSQEMANLNFDTRYTRGGMDEIGVLGNNFNKMSEKLERTVSELKQANNQLQKDIEQKEKIEDMRNEFLGNVSHELKTPIALIQGYAEGLKEGISEDPESREFYCDVIIDEAAKMNVMVKNLLTLNQLEFGSDEVQFERFDIEKNITIEGTGLGLAITKKLVELMNGKIVVQSIYGQGSKFTVALDQQIVLTPTVSTSEVLPKEDPIDLSLLVNKKVLIVDDNKINLKVASRLLKDYNIKTEEVDSGFECINRILQKEEYDLILLDDMMPKMSGVETLKKLKEISDFHTPTIALTANAISGMKEKYLKEGFDDYLSKPIDRKELNRVIRKFLNTK